MWLEGVIFCSCVVKRTGVLRALANAFVDAADGFRFWGGERTDVVRHVSVSVEISSLDGLGTKQRAFLASLCGLESLRTASVLVLFYPRLITVQFLWFCRFHIAVFLRPLIDFLLRVYVETRAILQCLSRGANRRVLTISSKGILAEWTFIELIDIWEIWKKVAVVCQLLPSLCLP